MNILSTIYTFFMSAIGLTDTRSENSLNLASMVQHRKHLTLSELAMSASPSCLVVARHPSLTQSLFLGEYSPSEPSPSYSPCFKRTHNAQMPFEEYKMSAQESREAKIADAFAHVAIAHPDIIAISTRRTQSDLKVVAITEDKVETSIPDTSIAQTPATGKKCSPKFFCTKNAWRKEPDPAMRNRNPFPVIVNSVPLVLENQTLETYLQELRRQW